jgi:hypothetical protein
MRFSVVALLCGAIWAAAVLQGQADEVDDLLAGKPLATQDKDSQSRLGVTPSLDERFSAPLEHVPLAEGSAWDATGTQPRTQFGEPSSDQAQNPLPAPSASITMVPEPQAIALAALALLYFLIFFRRRHLA